MSRRGPSIHVKNLADGVRHEDLRYAFGKYGHIVDVTVPVNYHSGRPKGFAFVEFEDYRDAEDAIYHLNHTRLRGREITVEFTRGTRKTPAEMRSRDTSGRRRSWRSRSRSRSRSHRRDRSSGRDRSASHRANKRETSVSNHRESRRRDKSRSISRSSGARNCDNQDRRERNSTWAEDRFERRKSAGATDGSGQSSRGGSPGRDHHILGHRSPSRSASPNAHSNSSRSIPASDHNGGHDYSQSPMRRGTNSR